jgi:dihydroxyacid dehydratase/phosphogluconate dehydratase
MASEPGTIVWEAREMMARGELDKWGAVELIASSALSAGHCNTMGTATTMNSLAGRDLDDRGLGVRLGIRQIEQA